MTVKKPNPFALIFADVFLLFTIPLVFLGMIGKEFRFPLEAWIFWIAYVAFTASLLILYLLEYNNWLNPKKWKTQVYKNYTLVWVKDMGEVTYRVFPQQDWQIVKVVFSNRTGDSMELTFTEGVLIFVDCHFHTTPGEVRILDECYRIVFSHRGLIKHEVL